MNYSKIETCNIGNGLGFRVVLWVSGCGHRCPGCQNSETWDPNFGKNFTDAELVKILEYLDKPYIKGLTLSGGDPLFTGNRKVVEKICRRIKELFPEKDVWLYTGYRYEDIKDLELLKFVDVIVDGRYEQEHRDITLPFRGSINQRILKKVNNSEFM